MSAYLLECYPRHPVTGAEILVTFSSNLLDETYLGRGQPYPVRLRPDYSFESMVFDGNTPGSSTMSVGTLGVNNTDGSFDYMLDYSWGGARTVVKIGPDFADYSKFTTIFTGSAQDVGASASDLTFVLRDVTWKLETLLQQNRYLGGGGKEGGKDIAGQPKPLCFGLCKNVSPVMVDNVRLIMQIHDGPLNGLNAVYDDATALTALRDYATYSELEAATIQPGFYAACLVEGFLRLGAPPEGAVTADVRGQFYTQTSISPTVYAILINRSELTSADIDFPSFQDWTVSNPGQISGLYYSSPDIQMNEFLETVSGTADSFATVTEEGKLSVKRFAFGVSQAFVRPEDVSDLQKQVSAKPVWKTTVQYDRNLTVLDASNLHIPANGLTGYLEEETVFFSAPYNYVGKFLTFIAGQEVSDLEIVDYEEVPAVPWLSLRSDGVFTVTDPGVDEATVTLRASMNEFKVDRTFRVVRSPKRLGFSPESPRVFRFKTSGIPVSPSDSVEFGVGSSEGATALSARDNLGNTVPIRQNGTIFFVDVSSLSTSPLLTEVVVTAVSGTIRNTMTIPVTRGELSVATGIQGAGKYADGTPIDDLKPAQKNATLGATLGDPNNPGNLLNTSGGNYQRADLYTREGTAANIKDQGSGATADSLAELNAQDETRLANNEASLVAIFSDSVLSRAEKGQFRILYDSYTRNYNEAYTESVDLLNIYGVDATHDQRAAMINSLVSLNGYLGGLTPQWDNVNVDTNVNGDTIRTLMADLAEKTKVLKNANSTYVSQRVKGILDDITSIGSDSLIAVGEKKQFIILYNQTERASDEAHSKSGALIALYGDDPTYNERLARDNAINDLNAYLNTLGPAAWNDVTGDTSVDGPALRQKFARVIQTTADLNAAVNAITAVRAQWNSVGGTGKPSDNASADLLFEATVRPDTIVVRGNTIRSVDPHDTQWSSYVVSKVQFTKGSYARFRLDTVETFGGLTVNRNGNGTALDNYNASACSVHWSGNGSWYIFLGGSAYLMGAGQNGVNFSAQTVWEVVYDNSTYYVYAEGVLMNSFATTRDRVHYFAATFGNRDRSISNIVFAARATTGSLSYSDGNSLEQLKPGQAGADVTGNNTANNIKNQGSLANQDNASGGQVKGGQIVSNTGAISFDLDNGRITFNNGAIMKVTGNAFGTRGQFLEWIGPTQASIANCSESNAVYYVTTTGDAYFGGSLSAGIKKNAAQTTSLAVNPSVTTGIFGSNGKKRTVTVSFNSQLVRNITTACPTGTITPSATVELYRGTDASGVLLSSSPFQGQYSCDRGFPGDPGSITEFMNVGISFDDNAGGVQVSYFARIINHSRNYQPDQQSLSILSVEQ